MVKLKVAQRRLMHAAVRIIAITAVLIFLPGQFLTAGAATTARQSAATPAPATRHAPATHAASSQAAKSHLSSATTAPTYVVTKTTLGLPSCKRAKPPVTAQRGVHYIMTFGCPSIDKARLGQKPVWKWPAKSRTHTASPAVTIPSLCPVTLSQMVIHSRSLTCFNVAVKNTANLEIVSNGVVESTAVVPLEWNIEMWAALSSTSRTWVITTNVASVLPINEALLTQPVTLSESYFIGCSASNPYCVATTPQATCCYDYTGDGTTQTVTTTFTDNTTTATTYTDNFFQIAFQAKAPWTSTKTGYTTAQFGNAAQPTPIRCDNQSNVLAYINGGCVDQYAAPTWVVSDQAYPKMDLVVKHMAAASCQLANYNGLTGCPGRPGSWNPLTYDPSAATANRNVACPSSVSPPPDQVALGNTGCDEYPLASTQQGGAGSDSCWVPPTANQSQGGAFGAFLAPNRMLPGDPFYIKVTYYGNTQGCDQLLQGSGTVTADNALNGMFNSYGDNATCADWSGGDATNSVPLPDGNRAWFFSDTFLNSPAQRKGLWYYSSIHNSIVMQGSSGLTSTIAGGNTCQETNPAIPFWNRYAVTPAAAPDPGGFYWTGDQMVVGSNVVKFYYHGSGTTSSFTIDYPAVATIPISSLESQTAMTISPTQFSCGSSSIIWGTSLLSWGGNVYIYGWANNGTSADSIYLAKTTAAGLTSPSTWQVYDGMSGSSPVWGNCGSAPVALGIDGTTGFSVAYVNSSLWLVQFDYTNGQLNASGAIGAHPSATPWGFTNASVALYTPPNDSVFYPYYYSYYEARIQPSLGAAGEVVISYNVNTEAVDTGCVSANNHDAAIYRPRFLDVPGSLFNPANAATAARRASSAKPSGTKAGKAAAMPGYGIRHSRPPFPAALPPVPPTTTATTATTATATVRTTAITPAATTGIDGSTDWYQDGPGNTCPTVPAPAAAPTLPTPSAGIVDASWPSAGTDVWYYGWICDATKNNCSTTGLTEPTGNGCASVAPGAPWVAAWATPAGNLWETQTTALLDPIDATTTAGNSTNGHTFDVLIQSFGAGNGNSCGWSPEASITVSR